MIARVCTNSFQFPIHSILLRISCTRSLLAVIIYRASLSSAKYIFGQRLLRGRGPSVVVISAGIAWHPFELVLPRLSFGTAISQIELADERPVSLDSPREEWNGEIVSRWRKLDCLVFLCLSFSRKNKLRLLFFFLWTFNKHRLFLLLKILLKINKLRFVIIQVYITLYKIVIKLIFERDNFFYKYSINYITFYFS